MGLMRAARPVSASLLAFIALTAAAPSKTCSSLDGPFCEQLNGENPQRYAAPTPPAKKETVESMHLAAKGALEAMNDALAHLSESMATQWEVDQAKSGSEPEITLPPPTRETESSSGGAGLDGGYHDTKAEPQAWVQVTWSRPVHLERVKIRLAGQRKEDSAKPDRVVVMLSSKRFSSATCGGAPPAVCNSLGQALAVADEAMQLSEAEAEADGTYTITVPATFPAVRSIRLQTRSATHALRIRALDVVHRPLEDVQAPKVDIGGSMEKILSGVFGGKSPIATVDDAAEKEGAADPAQRASGGGGGTDSSGAQAARKKADADASQAEARFEADSTLPPPERKTQASSGGAGLDRGYHESRSEPQAWVQVVWSRPVPLESVKIRLAGQRKEDSAKPDRVVVMLSSKRFSSATCGGAPPAVCNSLGQALAVADEAMQLSEAEAEADGTYTITVPATLPAVRSIRLQTRSPNHVLRIRSVEGVPGFPDGAGSAEKETEAGAGASKADPAGSAPSPPRGSGGEARGREEEEGGGASVTFIQVPEGMMDRVAELTKVRAAREGEEGDEEEGEDGTTRLKEGETAVRYLSTQEIRQAMGLPPSDDEGDEEELGEDKEEVRAAIHSFMPEELQRFMGVRPGGDEDEDEDEGEGYVDPSQVRFTQRYVSREEYRRLMGYDAEEGKEGEQGEEEEGGERAR